MPRTVLCLVPILALLGTLAVSTGCGVNARITSKQTVKLPEGAKLIYFGSTKDPDNNFQFSRPDGSGTYYIVRPDNGEVITAFYAREGEKVSFDGRVGGPEIAFYFVPDRPATPAPPPVYE